ncbi:unnamed protein product [Clonostachys solani]|uniref:Uncharacterized protein n=1 Tax=Clonostachys solani TaxID=160281 RepID=A0A9N9Z7Z6_9HYPO|nr:unnamed protein product [Clonostachys solani]
MDAQIMYQGQIRDAQHQRELKAEELHCAKDLKETLVQRLSFLASEIEAIFDYDLTGDQILYAALCTMAAHTLNLEQDGPPCPLEDRVMSNEAWLRAYIAEIVAQRDNIQEELMGITEQLEQQEK